jgi:hypothetical protein
MFMLDNASLSRLNCSLTSGMLRLTWMEDDLLWKLRAVARITFPKNLIRLFPVQDRKDEGSGDLLVRSLVHASDQIRVATVAAQQRE